MSIPRHCVSSDGGFSYPQGSKTTINKVYL